MSLHAGVSNAIHFEGKEYLDYLPKMPFRSRYDIPLLPTRTSSYTYISQTLSLKALVRGRVDLRRLAQ